MGLEIIKNACKEQSRLIKVNFIFITTCIETVKCKSAALHFETRLSTLQFLKYDIGNKQHSTKQSNNLLESVCTTLHKRINDKLCIALPSTGCPPHFFITFDKSTPGQTTNQAIMITPIVEGERVPYFVGAPEVYSVEEGEQEISGGESASLVSHIFKELHIALPNVAKSSCVGAVADGQYVMQLFTNALFSELDIPKKSFAFLVWDPSHFLNLVAKKFMDEPHLNR